MLVHVTVFEIFTSVMVLFFAEKNHGIFLGQEKNHGIFLILPKKSRNIADFGLKSRFLACFWLILGENSVISGYFRLFSDN